jgi:serum/glucocorticoid-regulated kinase 2
LQKNPKERLGYKGAAEEIKKHPWFRTINFNDLLEKK